MPIDLEAVRRLKEQQLNDYLRGSVNPTDTSSILRGRDETLSGLRGTLESAASQYGVSPSIVEAGQERADIGRRRLSQELQSSVNRRLLEKKQQQMSLIYSNAVRRLTESGYDLDSAKQYARQIALDEMERSFQSSESQKDREQALQQESIRNQYGDLELNSIRNQQDDFYRNALLRAGLASAGALGAGFVLKKRYGQPSDKYPSFSTPSTLRRTGTAGVGGYGVPTGYEGFPSLESQYGGYERGI